MSIEGARGGAALALLLMLGGCGSADDRARDAGASPAVDAGAGRARDAGAAPAPVECEASARLEADPVVRPSDIIWFVDNSGSMTDEAGRVRDNINAFASQIVRSGIDYRVVMLSASAALAGVRVPEPLASSPRFLQHDDVNGDTMIVDQLLEGLPSWEHFLREGSVRHLVVLSDADGCLSAPAALAALRDALEPPGTQLVVHTVAERPGPSSPACVVSAEPTFFGCHMTQECTGCGTGQPGFRLLELARMTGGVRFSICEDDWSPLFDQLAREVVDGASLPCELEVPTAGPDFMLDPAEANVVVTEAGVSRTPPRVSSPADCGDEPGWYFDDPVAPSRITLCPASCQAIEASTDPASIEVELGCEPVLR